MPDHDFGSIINNYANSMSEYRDFLDFATPLFAKEQVNYIKSERFRPFLLLMGKTRPDIVKKLGIDYAKLRAELADKATIVRAKNKYTLKILDAGIANQLIPALKRFIELDKRISLLHRGSLISLVGAAEWCFARLMHAYYHKFPEAIKDDDKCFSLNDLRGFETVEDARQSVIDSRIDRALRASFETWLKFLKETAKLSLGYIGKLESTMAEVYLRRNVVVHNGGIVNAVYMRRLGSGVTSKFAVGDEISVTKNYLDASIDLFERIFILIGAEMWKRIESCDKNRGPLLLNLAYINLLKSRWSIAESISKFGMLDAAMDDAVKLSAQINYWQAIKWQGKYSEIRGEVEAADFSARGEIFKLAKMALMDDLASFFARVESALDSKSIEYDALAIWPIFRSIRNTPQYKALYERRSTSFEKALSAAVTDEAARSVDIGQSLSVTSSRSRKKATNPKTLSGGSARGAKT